MSCDERSVLTARYREAVARNTGAGETVADLKSPEWREATHDTRMACEAALLALNEHRKEHGC